MWVFAKEGFYSAVEDRTDPSTIIVRARAQGDLERLLKLIDSDNDVVYGVGTDYPFRVWLTRDEWLRAVTRLSDGIDYVNFKDAVTAARGKKRHDTYMQVWTALLSLEPAKWKRRFGKWLA